MLFAILFALGIQVPPAHADQALDLSDRYQVFFQTCTDPVHQAAGLVKSQELKDVYAQLVTREISADLKAKYKADEYLVKIGALDAMKPSSILTISQEPSEQLGEQVHSAVYMQLPETTGTKDVYVLAVRFQTTQKNGYFSISEFASADHPDILGNYYCAPGEVSTVYLNSGLVHFRKSFEN